MDVVHPSSDMKTATGAAARPISRQGVTITPSVPARQPEASPSADVTEAPRAATGSQAWPDPLDMAGYQREPDTTTPAAEPEIPEIIPETSVNEPIVPTEETSEPDDEQSLSTPFLSGTKVEKRPLGTNSAEELDHAPVTSAAASEDETPNAENQLPAMPETTPIILPEELQTDLLSIESDVPTEPADTTNEASQGDNSNESKPTAALDTAAPAGPTSIQQQYTEQPNTGDATTGGIYDTDSYHQPLTHPAKKKAGWMWVVWVVLLLILGAAGGAIAYLYLLK